MLILVWSRGTCKSCGTTISALKNQMHLCYVERYLLENSAVNLLAQDIFPLRKDKVSLHRVLLHFSLLAIKHPQHLQYNYF